MPLFTLGDGRHEGTKRRCDVCAVGQFDRGTVLTGQKRSSMDGLTLSKEVRVFLANSLTGLQPLTSGAVLSGCVFDCDIYILALGERCWEFNDQCRAELFVTLAQGELHKLKDEITAVSSS